MKMYLLHFVRGMEGLPEWGIEVSVVILNVVIINKNFLDVAAARLPSAMF